MGNKRFILIIFLLSSAIFLASVRLVTAKTPLQQTRVFHPEADITLDVCMSSEPESLYYYSENQSIWQTQILSAIYDGPVDLLSYRYQPVIFESIPSFENGQVITESLVIGQGEVIVNSSGDVTSLEYGTWYLPSGCYDASCAAFYTGGSIEMEHIALTTTLQSDLTWSDGHELTSEDMIYSFNLAASPETPTSKYNTDRTSSYITTTLTQTVWTGLPGFFPFNYTVMYWTPLPEHVWSQYTPAELVDAPISNRTPLGWGAYVIDEWVPGDHILMHKNALYFRSGDGLPHFNYLMVHFGTELGGILSSICDVVVNSSDDLRVLLDYDYAGMLEVATSPGTVWEHLDFGIQSSEVYTGFSALTDAFQDVEVRKAFAYCIDRQAMVDWVYYDLGEVTDAFIPANHPYFPPDATVHPFDPVQGNALLASSGWVDSNGNGIRDKDGVEFSVTLKTTTAALRRTIASMISAQMAKCGIEVTPFHLPPGELFAGWPDGPIFGRKFDLGMFALLSEVKPPCDIYFSWNIPTNSNPGGQNNPGYDNPAYDAACMAGTSALKETDRNASFGEATRIFTQELPVLPLFWRLMWGITAPHITGFTLDPSASSFWNIEELGTGVEGFIPPEGGQLSSPSDTTNYFFTQGTFSDTVKITHTPLSPVVLPGFGELIGAGHFFSLEATLDSQSVEPSQPYTMTIGYTDDELGIIIENTLALYYWNGHSWLAEPTALVDGESNLIIASPNHFSYWAVLGLPYKFSYLPVVEK